MTVTYCNTDSFLGAWLRGIEIAGIEWFGDGAWSKSKPTKPTKWDYRPNCTMEELWRLSTRDAVFLAAMYSFYNPATGGRMLEELGYKSPGKLATTLGEPQLRVLADLMVAYEGW